MSGRRRDVLAVLRAADAPRSIGEVAEDLAVHPNTVRFHLQALVNAGQVECVEVDHDKPGRPPLMFQAVTGMDPAGPRNYQMLAGILADAIAREPDPVGSAISAGRAWAGQLAEGSAPADTWQAVEQLTDLLAEMGFAPENDAPTTIPDEVRLRSCPFLELAHSNADVVCSIHLGLMQGALSAWAAPITVEELTPFAEPDLCVARLTLAGQAS